MSDTTVLQRWCAWIKTQDVVIREFTTDGGLTWKRETADPTGLALALAAWNESARQQSLIDYGYNLVTGENPSRLGSNRNDSGIVVRNCEAR